MAYCTSIVLNSNDLYSLLLEICVRYQCNNVLTGFNSFVCKSVSADE